MATVSVDTGPIAADDRVRDVPEDKWFLLTLARRRFVQINLPYDCRSLLMFVAEAREHRIWERTGHADLESYISEGLGIDPEVVTWATEGLAKLDTDKPVTLRVAVEIGKQVAEARENPMKEHGGDRKSPDQGDIITLTKTRRGTEKTYTLRRLARDRPDLLDRVEAGELSANAAAIEAGWRKPIKTIPVDTPDNAVNALLRVFSVDDLLRALGRVNSASENVE